MKNSLLFIMLIVPIALLNVSEAKNCTKGKACGDTCIAQTSVCHIGSGSTTTTPTTTTNSCITSPSSCGLFTQQQIDDARQSAIAQCKANPISCGIELIDTNGSTQVGIDECKSNPENYGLVTEQKLSDEKENAISLCKTNPISCGIELIDTNGTIQEGIDQCKNDPISCGITIVDTNGTIQEGIDQCKNDPVSCGIMASDSVKAVYDSQIGEVYIPQLRDNANNVYEIYLLQKPNSFEFELDFNRLKIK